MINITTIEHIYESLIAATDEINNGDLPTGMSTLSALRDDLEQILAKHNRPYYKDDPYDQGDREAPYERDFI